MAKVTYERTGALLRTAFRVILEAPDAVGLQAKDVIAKVAERCPPNEYENGTYGDGTRRFDKILRFSSIDCVKAGWLVKQRGIWSITEEGKIALEKYKVPSSFHKEASKLYWIWKQNQGDMKPDSNLDSSDGIDVDKFDINKDSEIILEEVEERARTEISKYIESLPPFEFQGLVAQLLVGMGYHINEEAMPGPDGGVDIVAFSDPLGAKAPRLKVQVKRQIQPADISVVKQLASSITKDDVGLFFCTGGGLPKMRGCFRGISITHN